MKTTTLCGAARWLIWAVTLILGMGSLRADNNVQVVSPATFKDKEGEGESTIFTSNGTDLRFQQFYTSANFTASTPNGGYIREISFRSDGKVGNGTAAVLTHVEIHLAYAGAFNQISTEYSKNEGPGYSLAYAGSLSIPAMISSQYNVSVVLQTPFYYDPRAGNLMLDYVTIGFGGFGAGHVDETNLSGESVSQAGNRFLDFSVGLLDGGLVTKFTIDPVPEPGFAALLALGGAILVMVRRRSEP